MSNISSLDSLRKKDAEENQDNEYFAGGISGQGGGSGLSVVGGGGGPPRDVFGQILSKAAQESSQADAEEQMVQVTFYSNGFTVGDGPLRETGIRENDRFLQQVSQGFCPEELIVNGKPSAVKLVDKRSEAYTPPPYIAFSGGGQTAGSSSSASSGSVITPAPGRKMPDVDESQPTIRVQLVFENRKRQVVTLNKTNTVRDLSAIIDNSGNVSGPYQMLTSVRGPPKPIEDLDASVEPLAGAAVTVKGV